MPQTRQRDEAEQREREHAAERAQAEAEARAERARLEALARENTALRERIKRELNDALAAKAAAKAAQVAEEARYNREYMAKMGECGSRESAVGGCCGLALWVGGLVLWVGAVGWCCGLVLWVGAGVGGGYFPVYGMKASRDELACLFGQVTTARSRHATPRCRCSRSGAPGGAGAVGVAGPAGSCR